MLVPKLQRLAARQMDTAMTALNHVLFACFGGSGGSIVLALDGTRVTAKNEVDRSDHCGKK